MILGCLMPVRADVVFQDNFGSGNLNNWTVVGSPNIVSTPTVAGSTYAVQFPSNAMIAGMPSSNVSYIQAPFPQASTATLEFYFQFDANATGTEFADIINGGFGNLWLLLAQYVNNGSLYFAFTYPLGKGSFSRIVFSGAQSDVWYKFDIAVNQINGAIQLSINDSPVFSINELFGWNPTIFILGDMYSTANNTSNIYIDDVTITNTANISQSTVTPSPTISPTPTPTPSPTQPPTPTPSTTTVPATTNNGAAVDLAISGNVTSSQMSNVTITTNQRASATTVSFTVTGESGATGFGNITIPKSAVSYGTTPTIYIDNQPASNQGYTQDSNNYYVWYTTQFSTHEISIVFTATPVPEFPTWVILPLFAAVILLSVVFIRKKMPKK